MNEKPAPQEDTPETRGEVKATRTYSIENAMDEVVTQLYVYPTENENKGENLAGDGLIPGENVRATLTGYMLHTENETLFTIEYVAGSSEVVPELLSKDGCLLFFGKSVADRDYTVAVQAFYSI